MTKLKSIPFYLGNKFFGAARQLVNCRIKPTTFYLESIIEKNHFLNGQTAALQVRQLRGLTELSDAAFSVYSQWAEDGIIEWLVHILDIKNTSFIEFGVETFQEANCRFLLENRNWRGLIFDGSAENINKVHQKNIYWKYDLTALQRFITAENINTLIEEAGFSGNVGILSIDVDGVDYWILEAISCVKADILILEYNGIFGDLLPISVPYREDFERYKAHYSGLYYGASLKALEELAKSKGYVFIGTPRTGVNAFFVHEELADKVFKKLKKITSYPTRYREARDADFTLNYTRGITRFELLKNLYVTNLATGENIKMEEPEKFYSPEWLDMVK